jgi:hypothetical protein
MTDRALIAARVRDRATSIRRSQGEVERGATTDLAFGPDPTTVPANDTLHRCEADAGPLELRRGMKALEDPEQLVRVRLLEAGAVVANEKGRMALRHPATHFDLGVGGLARELPGVGEEVIQCGRE